VTNTATGVCQYKEAHVGLEFGILPDGSLRYVDVTQSSGYALYDERAVAAVRQAAPFPPVPDDVMARQPIRSAAVAVRAQFNYVVR
jgi:TonB family protein